MTTSMPWLVRTAIALGVLELADTVVIWVEDYPGAAPVFAVVFGLLFLGTAWLLTRYRVVGLVVMTLLCLFELANFPGWERHNAFDWTYQCLFALLSLAGLVLVALAAFRSRHGTVNA